MSQTLSPRRREHKKAETWAAIHEAAASLALQRGVEQATVEAISDSAGVSPRTFFNYFHAKEDAILGVHEPVLDPELLSGFSASDDLLGQVSRLLVTVARTAIGAADAARRRQLMVRYPNLGRRQMEYMAQAEVLVRQAVTDVLADDPSWSGGAEGFSPDEAARMLVMLAGVPLHFNLTSPDFDPVKGLAPEDLGPSLALLHHLQRKLS